MVELKVEGEGGEIRYDDQEGMTWSFCGQKSFLLFEVGRKWESIGGVAGEFVDPGAGNPLNYWLNTCSARVPHMDHKNE